MDEEQKFIFIAFVLSLVLSFSFGYMVFNYQLRETCRPEMLFID